MESKLSPGPIGGAKSGIWELGYGMCLDVFRVTDSLQRADPVVVKHLKECSLAILQELSKCSGSKVNRMYVKRLKQLHMLVRRLGTLLLFLHDLNHVPSNKYLDLNGKVNLFSGRLRKIINYNERRLKRKSN